ncbi:hypothetical protein ACFL0K_01365 [Patescibacteria group bacterium]
MEIINLIKILAPFALTFFIGIAITPILTHYLYKYKMWKKTVKSVGMAGGGTPIFSKLHAGKEIGTPKMGGVIIWASVFIAMFVIWIISEVAPTELSTKLDFLSRNQTWLPLFTFTIGALVGLIDDWLEVSGKADYIAGGLSLKKRLGIVFVMGGIGAWWFFVKLGVASVLVPFVGEIFIGIWFIPFFIAVMLALYSSGVIDGIDGLAGGVFSLIYSAYGIIAFFQNQIDLAAFSFAIAGGLLAFLWFNIPPARFYMAETGSMALTVTLAVVAFLTGHVLLLPIIAFPLFATVVSNIIQVGSKKFRSGKKVFQVAPIHHHFEAIGWPGYKVTMRYWIITAIFATMGVIIALVG